MATQEVRHPLFARLYDRLSAKAEERGFADHRRRTLEGLAGRVVEVGAGNGLNFAHYPAAVGEVVAVEPEPYLRARAEEAARSAPVQVRVVGGVADELPVEDGSMDAGIASLVLCTVPDPERALTELFRVIRPEGGLRFHEHVVATRPGSARAMRIADATLWPRVAGGCHLARDTEATIAAAGFRIERCERFTFRFSLLDPPKPHVLGAALRP